MKKIHGVSLALALGLAFAAPAQADVAKGMNAMWNYTSASSGGVNGNVGGTLGGFSARVPNRSFAVFAYDAPRIQAGCGGIDLYFGSFSMISGANITDLMRGIVSNASGYAFKMALDSVCPKCQSVLSGLQDAVSKIGAGNMNTCQIASMAVDVAVNKPGARDNARGAINSYFEGVESAVKGVRQDFASAFSATNSGGKNANRDPDADKKDSRYGNSLVNTLISTKVITPNMADPNQPWGIFGNPKSFAEIAMSLYGTTVVLTGTEAQGTNKEGKDDKVLPALWTFEQFLYGNRTGEGRMQSYTCSDFSPTNAGGCQKTGNRESDWYGMKRHVVTMLAGKQSTYGDSKGDDTITKIQDASIMGMLLNNDNAEKLTDEQRRFRNHLSSDMMEALSDAAQCGPRTAAAAAETASDLIAKQMAGEVILKLNHQIKTAYGMNTVQSGGEAKSITPLSDEQKAVLSRLEEAATRAVSVEAKAEHAQIIRRAVCVTKQRGGKDAV